MAETHGTGDAKRSRRRQARGERRIDEILTAATAVFARVGYDATTTNAIAAEAGISPGSLYQYFANKGAIARAMADRYVAFLESAREEPISAEAARTLPLGDLIDAVVDPLIAFNLANPGFKALFARPDLPPEMTAAVQPIQFSVHTRVDRLFAAAPPNWTRRHAS